MNAGSLFSGCGGLDLAVERHFGVKPLWMCEPDRYCRRVLEHRFPGTPVLSDVRECDYGTPHVDVLHGGYPCQPFSDAGKRDGVRDQRNLWPEFARLVRLLRPRVVVAENVAGHLVLGFDRVLSVFASLGMDVRWGVVRASDAGAPHKRSRLFAVATNPGQERRERSTTLNGTDAGMDIERRRVVDGRPMGTEWGPYRDAIERWEHITGVRAPQPTNDRGSLMPEFVEWMMGFPIGWTEGPSRTQRLMMLGNSVCPQQGTLALELLT